MSSTESDDIVVEDTLFDWNKYLELRHAEEVPEDFFYHICKSEQNGIELGSVVEVENEDQSGYWFASVCSSKGVLLNLHYFGDENDKHDFWLEVKSPRIHSLNWGSENKKKLVPPHPDKCSRINPRVIKEKVQNCEHIVSSSVLQMNGAPIYNIFKSEMLVEVQDKEFPYRVWVSKIIRNVGGRLLLKMQGLSSPENNPFWLFYLNERIFPLGWADQKGLPWRVMNSEVNVESTIDSSILLDVLKPKTPEQHCYKVGEMLEVINPYSLMVFYVATIVKIYDNRYFKVEVNNDGDIENRITFVATKENPYLFSAGWASKHNFLLKPPLDWNMQDTFCWSKYILMNNSKLANVDNTCRKKIDYINIGMKLEVVDPIDHDRIRVATVKGYADHWLFLTFDRSNWSQELLHVRSVYSDEIFPVGWCNKHKYSLSTPTIFYHDFDDFENFYYASDVDIDFKELENAKLIKNQNYLKGDIFYHYSKKDSRNSEDKLEKSIQNMLNDNCIPMSDVLKTDINEINYIDPSKIKTESPELDEEFHDALFLEETNNENDTIKVTEEVYTNNESNIKEKDEKKEEITFSTHVKTFDENNYTMCIYFNKSCYSGSQIITKAIEKLPMCIGPGPVSLILQEAITLFIHLGYFPSAVLKKIRKFQNILFNGPGGFEVLVKTQSRTRYSEYLLLPESKKMAQTYCFALCNLFGICQYFMTTEKSKCINDCNLNKYNINLKSKTETPVRAVKRRSTNYLNNKKEINSVKRDTLNEQIAKIASKELNWSNKSLVKRYKYYLACIVNYEAHLLRLNRSFTQLELAILSEIQTKKNQLSIMDEMNLYNNTNSDINEEDTFNFIQNWKSSFENCYSQDPRFKKRKIDIGHLEQIEVKSNPKYWSPKDVYNYLTNDPYCKDIKNTLLAGEVDGIAFMLLNEEQLFYRLRCPITLTIRMLCHVAEVKYICLTEYSST